MIVFHRYHSSFEGIQWQGVSFCLEIRIASTPGTGGQAAGNGRREYAAGLAREKAIVGGNRSG
ncbi:MAG: hypothetical protein IT261_11845 [Saprospiraceae bacterium]|nr:hypothetical protein [Saprospiraceae bacterium]